MANSMIGRDGTALSYNIAFIEQWTLTPEPLHENPVPSSFTYASNASQYIMSFDHENETAKAFAVMLFMPDNKREIAAVCVEELRGGIGLIVRVAMNTGDLTPLVSGMKSVASHLQLVANRGGCSVDSKPRLVNDIIKCNLKRIMSCLRSRRAETMPGDSLIRRLLEVSNIISAYSTTSELRKKNLSKCVCEINSIFKKLESLSENELERSGCLRIAEIMEQAQKLTKVYKLGDLIENVPSEAFNKCSVSTKNLVESFDRLSQYLEMARHLLCIASHPKYRGLFKSIEVLCENRNCMRAEDNRCLQPANNVKSCLEKWLDNPTAAKKKIAAVRRELKRSAAEVLASIKSRGETSKKVHAEIQLLLYYELRADDHLRPRVLCSCKHACFLCDTLIKAHGKFYCPSTHGTLYPKWRIPTPDQLGLQETEKLKILDVAACFNEAIEAKINSLVNEKRPKQDGRNEYCIFRQGSSTSLQTIYANPTTQAQDRIQAFSDNHHSILLEAPQQEISSNSEVRHLEHSIPLHRRPDSGVGLPNISQLAPSQLQPAIMRTSDIFTIMEHNPEAETRSSPSLRQDFHPIAVQLVRLTQGEAASQRLEPGSAVRFHSRKIHLEFEYGDMLRVASASNVDVSGLATDDNRGFSIIVEATWMGNDFAGTLPSTNRCIDLSMTWIDMTITQEMLFTDEGLVFRKRRDIVTVKARMGNR